MCCCVVFGWFDCVVHSVQCRFDACLPVAVLQYLANRSSGVLESVVWELLLVGTGEKTSSYYFAYVRVGVEIELGCC